MQTRVGYAGGTEHAPTYRQIGSHAEVIRVVFDPRVLSYGDLLDRYRSWHSPSDRAGQYRSIVIATTGDQDRALRGDEVRAQLRSKIVDHQSVQARFWDAEDYHQKWYLRRDKSLVKQVERALGPDWDRHTIATKINAQSVPGFDASPWLERLTLGQPPNDIEEAS